MSDAFKARIGVDLNRRIGLEPGIEWAAARDIRFLDICLDPDPELLTPGGERRLAAAGERLRSNGITLGLHTLSAVNMAESSPFLSRAMDDYLAAYIRAGKALGAGWVIVHAGYHFTADKRDRMQSGLDRIRRTADLAEREGMTLLLENMNPEPDGAEVQYLAHDAEECRFYFDQLHSPALKWSFTLNHAYMTEEGIEGFLDALDLGRCGEVRLADNRGEIEEHLRPGEGTMDFAAIFALIEGRGYRGHYMQDYTTIEDMAAGREILARYAPPA